MPKQTFKNQNNQSKRSTLVVCGFSLSVRGKVIIFPIFYSGSSNVRDAFGERKSDSIMAYNNILISHPLKKLKAKIYDDWKFF